MVGKLVGIDESKAWTSFAEMSRRERESEGCYTSETSPEGSY
jgi:hypothetical protein